MTSEAQHRCDIVDVCKHIYEHGWFAATDGNVSIRLEDGSILTTPTGVHKGLRMTEGDLLVVDAAGRRVSGTRDASSELRMHLAAYQERPDIRAVVHAHPTNCIAFSLAGISLAQCLLPEIVFTFGSIPTTAYTTPTTEEVPAEVRKWIRKYDAMILDRHGSLTVGSDVFAAYDKLERMEHVAEITYRARMLGPVRPLTRDQITRLQQVGQELGLPKREVCEHCNVCEPDDMIKRVAEQIGRTLR
jgi:L-fuculose-phosphate aldolase